MALKRVWIASPNCSGRSGSGVRLVVVHTAEGARSYRDLGNFFASRSAQVSSHTGIDDERGTIGEYVHRPDKAWTQAAYNSQAVSTELCAAPINSPYPCGARWTAEEWSRHPNMLANLADWIREECAHYGLPINKLSSSQAQGGARGVCGHVDLGAGGGHYDPGPNFPWARVMTLARGGKPDIPAGTPSQENDMICSALNAAAGTPRVRRQRQENHLHVAERQPDRLERRRWWRARRNEPLRHRPGQHRRDRRRGQRRRRHPRLRALRQRQDVLHVAEGQLLERRESRLSAPPTSSCSPTRRVWQRRRPCMRSGPALTGTVYAAYYAASPAATSVSPRTRPPRSSKRWKRSISDSARWSTRRRPE